MKKFLFGAFVGSAVTTIGFFGTEKGWFKAAGTFVKNLVTKKETTPEEATPAKQTA